MDNSENTPVREQPDLSGSDIIAYLFKRISALENRIEKLENEKTVFAEKESALLSKADSADKKLDLLIWQMENLTGGIEDTGKTEHAKPQSVPVTAHQAQSTAKTENLSDGIEDIGKSKPAKPQSIPAAVPQTQSTPKQIAVFIDGENISHKKAADIIEKAKNRGSIEFARVYGIQNNNSDKPWVKTSAQLGIKHIRLAGGSKKNKVDKKMFDEILNETKKAKHADTIIIATNDTDFIPTIENVRSTGVHVIIMGLKSSLSDKMKKSCDSFIYL